MKTIKFRIEGTQPLMTNNPQTVNPFNEYTKALKVLTAKRKRTEDDQLKIFRLKFAASLYIKGDGTYYIPCDHFHKSVCDAAKEQKMGTKFKQSFFVYTDCPLEFPDKDKDPDRLFDECKQYVDVRDAGIKGDRIPACRAIFPRWSTTVECFYDESQIDESDIIRFMEIAGLRKGVGTYRIKFGRFKATKI